MREEIIGVLNTFRPKISAWQSKTFSPTLTDFYIMPDIPQDKILKAIENYGSGIDPQSVIIYHDRTILGSGKKGFIITPDLIVYQFGKETIRADIRGSDSIRSKSGDIQINGKSLEIMTDNRKALADAYQLIRTILFILKSKRDFSSAENAMRIADYVWEQTMGIQFAGVSETSWHCSCGTINPLNKAEKDQDCAFCLNTRNNALISAAPRLVEIGLTNGKVTPEDIHSEFPWLLKDKAQEHIAKMEKGARASAGFGLGCLTVSSLIFLFGLWALFFRPPKWGLPGLVVIGILALGLTGIKQGWSDLKSRKKKTE